MNIHKQIAAWLAIVMGVVSLLVMLVVFLFLGGVAAFVGDATVTGVFALLGTFIFFFVGFFAVADIIAGILYLRGSSGARIWLIISNILFLFGFPFGTLVGAYSLWALLSNDGDQATTNSSVPPQA
ncbi:hypothetical protein H8K35_14175 [Undibacterium sp. LX40W]|uniref:DUF4064 domain-containing protein n=1 Tax=Undibacterium nitidum TaxID=2762298 RepID=A0A923HNY9_9BURK|nr:MULTISPECIES: hypothetical protein [Undibacterium]MBC3882537.1 hypothetical protein [Undibacterium nitidum]MBC3892818.1 hypothetical protein [Undibacterium sp. LX40W]